MGKQQVVEAQRVFLDGLRQMLETHEQVGLVTMDPKTGEASLHIDLTLKGDKGHLFLPDKSVCKFESHPFVQVPAAIKAVYALLKKRCDQVMTT